MQWHEYWRLWARRAFGGTVARAQLATGLLAVTLSPIGWWWEPWSKIMSWLPSLAFLGFFAAAVVAGFINASYLIHKDTEKERDDLRNKLDIADKIEGGLVELGKMRRRGVSLRNDLAQKDSLDEQDEMELGKWNYDVMSKIREISPSQAELFDALDIIHIVLPDYIARHQLLVHHSERLSRLKDFIDKYDAMLMGSRGLGRS